MIVLDFNDRSEKTLNSEGLKACPFCESLDVEVCNDSWTSNSAVLLFWVECECGASGQRDVTPELAKNHWNTRDDL